MQPTTLLMYAQRLQALAQAGIAYPTTNYDLERYREIRTISASLLQELTDEPSKRSRRIRALPFLLTIYKKVSIVDSLEVLLCAGW